MSKRLSIMIPTIPCREKYLERLLSVLEPQLTSETELIIEKDDAEISIGAKRNLCIAKSTGDYLCFIDDDDLISERYVQLIMERLAKNPDCVGFKVKRFHDGIEVGEQIISMKNKTKHSDLGNPKWGKWFRLINHLTPVRRELVLQVPFRDANKGEDCDFAEMLKPLLRTEEYIDEYLYTYLWRKERPKEITHRSKTGLSRRM